MLLVEWHVTVGLDFQSVHRMWSGVVFTGCPPVSQSLLKQGSALCHCTEE